MRRVRAAAEAVMTPVRHGIGTVAPLVGAPSYPGTCPRPAERECAVTFQQMLKTLWTRKLTIVVSVVVCVVAALAYAKVATPTYQSSALIQVTTPSQSRLLDVVRLHPARPGPGAGQLRGAGGGGQEPPRSPSGRASAAW